MFTNILREKQAGLEVESLKELSLVTAVVSRAALDGKYVDKRNLCHNCNFYPTALKGCQGIVFTHGVRMRGRAAGNSLSGLYLRNQVHTWQGHWLGGCRCATSWSELDLTFDLAIATLSLKILSGLYLRNREV